MRGVVTGGLIALALIGCDDARVPPNVAAANRSYRITECVNKTTPSPTTTNPPCTAHVGGLSRFVVDSGRIVLQRDHSLTWMIANSTCLSGACTSSGIDTASGAYEISNDTIFVLLTHKVSSGDSTFILISPMPDRVPLDWAGPGVMTLDLSNQPYYATFKP